MPPPKGGNGGGKVKHGGELKESIHYERRFACIQLYNNF